MNCYLWFYIFNVSYGIKVYTIVLRISFDPQLAFEPIGSNLRQMLINYCRFHDNRQADRAEEL